MNPTDQFSPSFRDSLLAFTKATSEAGVANDASPKAAHKQWHALDDAKETRITADHQAVQAPVPPAQTVPSPQILVAEQVQLPLPSVASLPALLGVSSDGSIVAADQPMPSVAAARLLGNGPIIARSGFVQSAGAQTAPIQPGSDLPQIASTISGAITQENSAPIAPVAPITSSSKSADHSFWAIPNGTSNPSLNVAPDPSMNTVPSPGSAQMQNVVPKALQEALSSPVRDAYSNARPNASQNAVPVAAELEMQRTASKADWNTLLSSPLSTTSDAVPSPVQSIPWGPAADNGQNVIQQSKLPAISPSVPSALPGGAPIDEIRAGSAVSKAILGAFQNGFAIEDQNSIPSPIVGAFSSAHLSADVKQAMKAAASQSAKGGVGPEGIPTPPTASLDQAIFTTGLGVPGVTADLLVALNEFTGRSLEAGKAAVSNRISVSGIPSMTSAANGKDGPKEATNDATGLKQHPLSASTKPELQIGLQDSTQSSDQSQGGNSSHGQIAASVPTNFANHEIIAVNHTLLATTIASPVQSVPTGRGTASPGVVAPGNPLPLSTAVPHPLPVINTAKLIQSIGQSEMRVGMRSNEFGNISISTSATRDSISAQISLDHSELARTLAAHLPEMQEKLGSNQALDVRIDLNGAGARQGTGTSGGMANGSDHQSRDGGQQPGSAASIYSANGFAERRFSPVPAATLTGDGRLSARLDIRA